MWFLLGRDLSWLVLGRDLSWLMLGRSGLRRWGDLGWSGESRCGDRLSRRDGDVSWRHSHCRRLDLAGIGLSFAWHWLVDDGSQWLLAWVGDDNVLNKVDVDFLRLRHFHGGRRGRRLFARVLRA